MGTCGQQHSAHTPQQGTQALSHLGIPVQSLVPAAPPCKPKDARRSEVLLPRAQKKPEGCMASKFKSTYSFVRTLFHSWLHFFVIPGHSPVIWVSCGTAEATNSFSPCELYRCVRDQTYFREALLGGCPWGLNPSPIYPLPSELGPDASLKQRSLLSSRSKT